MAETEGLIQLNAGATSLVLDAPIGGAARVLYFGKALTPESGNSISDMTTRQHAPGSADTEIQATLLNELGAGVSGASGFLAHRNGADWATQFKVVAVERPTSQGVILVCESAATQIRARHDIRIDPESSILTFQTEIENIGSAPLTLDWCASACLPLDPRLTVMLGFTGRWANEFQCDEIKPFLGSYLRENKTGRSSHDSFPALIFGTAQTDEQNGACLGLHLGWSGNHRLRVDRLSDGRASVQAGAYFFPGEMSLAPGAVYGSPPLHMGYSDAGYSALSRQFHRHVRHSILDGRSARKARPIHYNTWEAVYFEHDRETLFRLAETAAQVGAERFILDDGWFGGRRGDKAGLGDWWVSKDVYPDGLGPLITHVNKLGMEFGLWFEPEMVNPDSDLYRQYPEWVLQAEGVEQVPFRGQYALDLTRAEVSDYLFDQIDALLRAHPIAYIKWDMNRDIHHPGSHGQAVAHRQVEALYSLIDRIRARHPKLEIETCASGGGRADYGILQRTDRIWTSDSNDALDRQRIQRGASHFFPLAIMGAHVGPRTCHITGRKLSMKLRVATALFGHMGMELNLLSASDQELQTLQAGIALHKQYRPLIHHGDFHRLDTPDHVNAVGCVSQDRAQALFSWCNLTGHRETLPGRFFVPGLDDRLTYRVRVVWPDPVRSVSAPSVLDRLGLSGNGALISGQALANIGLQLPLLHPETCLIFSFEAID